MSVRTRSATRGDQKRFKKRLNMYLILAFVLISISCIPPPYVNLMNRTLGIRGDFSFNKIAVHPITLVGKSENGIIEDILEVNGSEIAHNYLGM